MQDIEILLKNQNKNYEYFTTTRDPVYMDMLEAVEIVKNFIISENLIVYGGTSIDYALRLHGDKIYPDDMLKVPDLDFYSPENIKHSYELADILYKKGWTEARAINALHTETMRVDIKDNHFIADITYRPAEIFAQLPTLNYNGMRIIHPFFQRIDLHSSLCFPYDNAPREVIFDRWNKDIERFNKLDQYYPVKHLSETEPLRSQQCELVAKRYILCGSIAYALLYTIFCQEIPDHGLDLLKASFIITDTTIDYKGLGYTELLHFDIKKCATELKIQKAQIYEPYINLLPKKIQNKNTIIYSVKNRLISCNSVTFNQHIFRVANIQYLLKEFLSLYFVTQNNPLRAATYIYYYTSLIAMINRLEAVYTQTQAEKSPFFPSVYTYGNTNINKATQVALLRLKADINKTTPPNLPRNYYPEKSIKNNQVPPVFDTESLNIFRERGRVIDSFPKTTIDPTV